MKEYKKLLLSNKAWASERLAVDENYFENLSKDQNPLFLWIGCADSRVPAEEITHADPGEIFVHRNVANMVVHTDLNMLSVLQYAVEVLKVKHIIVCGHYGCSGVHAALDRRRVGLADNWLRHVQDVHNKHERYLGEVLPPRERRDRLCELNVLEQVVNVCQTTIVQDAWARGQELTVHGWIYGLKDGLLRDLKTSASSSDEEAAVYPTAVAALSQ